MKKKIKSFDTAQGAFTVKFGINQLVAIEKEIGGFDKLEGDIKFENILIIFYHGLKATDKSVTKEDAGEAIDAILEDMEFKDFVDALVDTMTSTFKGTPSDKAE